MADLKTIRITKATASAEHRVGPDGSMKIPEGTVVAVGEGYNKVDQSTAARWVRMGFAEEFEGEPGQAVSNEDAAKSPAALAAEITRLQALHQAAVTRAAGAGAPTRITRAGAPGEGATGSPQASLDAAERASAQEPDAEEPGQPLGAFPYNAPDEPKLAEYDFLSDEQRTALHAAGFTSKRHIDAGSDEDITAVQGIGPGTLRRLRGR